MDVRNLYIGHCDSSESLFKLIGVLCLLTKYLSEQKNKELTCTEVWQAILKKLPAVDQWAVDIGKLADVFYLHADSYPTFGYKPAEYSKQLLKIFHEEITPF